MCLSRRKTTEFRQTGSIAVELLLQVKSSCDSDIMLVCRFSPRQSPHHRLCGWAPSSEWTSSDDPGSVSWGFPPGRSLQRQTQINATPALEQTKQLFIYIHLWKGNVKCVFYIFGAGQSVSTHVWRIDK